MVCLMSTSLNCSRSAWVLWNKPLLVSTTHPFACRVLSWLTAHVDLESLQMVQLGQHAFGGRGSGSDFTFESNPEETLLKDLPLLHTIELGDEACLVFNTEDQQETPHSDTLKLFSKGVMKVL